MEKLYCSGCKQFKDPSEFYKKDCKRGYTYHCIECMIQETKEHDRERKYPRKTTGRRWGVRKRDDPMYYKTYTRWKLIELNYGLSKEDYQAMMAQQKGLCALCGKPLPDEMRKRAVDHDHATGKVRGIVHKKCNTLLGLADDSIERLQQAIEYLKKHEEKT